MSAVIALVLVLAIDLMLFFGQYSINALAREAGITDNQQFYNYEGSSLSKADSSGNTQVNGLHTVTNDTKSEFEKINPPTTNIFYDVFVSVKNWILDSTGLGYLFNMVNAFPNFLQAIGLPEPIPFGLGAVWHILTIYLIVQVIFGRQ